VLTGLEQVTVCVDYDVDGSRHEELPVKQSDFHHAVPVYEYLPGWWEDISEARTIEDLPANARTYVERVEQLSGARITAVGVGPARDATIVVHDLL
jgi:adenylosuccinate synthase